MRLQPMASAEGARRAISGTSRMRLLIPTVGACWAVSSAFLAIAFGYICLTAHIDFGGREALCLAGITAASLLSCGIGAVVGALPGSSRKIRAVACSPRRHACCRSSPASTARPPWRSPMPLSARFPQRLGSTRSA